MDPSNENENWQRPVASDRFLVRGVCVCADCARLRIGLSTLHCVVMIKLQTTKVSILTSPKNNFSTLTPTIVTTKIIRNSETTRPRSNIDSSPPPPGKQFRNINVKQTWKMQQKFPNFHLPHMGQACFRISWWHMMCVRRSHFILDVLSQMWQSNGRWFLCLNSWSVHCWAVVNPLLQMLHLNGCACISECTFVVRQSRHLHVRFLRVVLLHVQIHSVWAEHLTANVARRLVAGFAVKFMERKC